MQVLSSRIQMHKRRIVDGTKTHRQQAGGGIEVLLLHMAGGIAMHRSLLCMGSGIKTPHLPMHCEIKMHGLHHAMALCCGIEMCGRRVCA